MKNILYPSYLFLICIIISSCDKLPKNGDLDGMWHLMTIEHGGTTDNVKDTQLYLSFQLNLFQLTTIENNKICYGYFDHNGDSIIFRQFSEMAEEHPTSPDNYPITSENISIINQWGFYALRDSFYIEHLTKNDMILRSKYARITYRKF